MRAKRSAMPAAVVLVIAVGGCNNQGSSSMTLVATTSQDFGGYRVLLPEGTTVISRSGEAHEYAYQLPDGLYEYNVRLTPGSVTDLEAAVQRATEGAPAAVERKDKLDQGFFVQKRLTGPLVEMWVFRHAQGHAGVTARCTGPDFNASQLVHICQSVEIGP